MGLRRGTPISDNQTFGRAGHGPAAAFGFPDGNFRRKLAFMLSMRAVHAGDGYAYLLSSVASHDDSSRPELRLHDYYDATGTPPGRWFGRGISGLGETSVSVNGVVEEFQMAALYGEGLHPDAEEKVANGATVKSTQLGRRYPTYSKGVPVLEAIVEAERIASEGGKRILSLEERNDIGLHVARPYFEEATGAYDAGGREVLDWLNEQKHSVRQAVSGIDLTFSPPKSISVVWAVADEETRAAIQSIHDQCVADALQFIEDNCLVTRTGDRSQIVLKARGMIASAFTHYDTRTGDPDLHTHCLISNKVQAVKTDAISQESADRWRAIDQPVLFQNSAKAGQLYNRMMSERLSNELGFAFRERTNVDGKASTWEVAGVTDEEIDRFSTRRAQARQKFEEYARLYMQEKGRTPSKRLQYKLWQKAVLETRDAKKPARSLREHREDWSQLVDGEDIMRRVRSATDDRKEFPKTDSDTYTAAIESLAYQAVDDTRERRSDFRPRHLFTSVTMRLNEWQFATEEEGNAAREAAIEYAMNNLVAVLSDTSADDLPQSLRDDNGLPLDRTSESTVLIAYETFREEKRILDAMEEITALFATRADVDAELESFSEDTGVLLNRKQVQMVRHMVESGKKISAAVGPAGTGKTTSLSVVGNVWKRQGHNVIALAPSATAAESLGRDIGAEDFTLQSLTYRWRGLTPSRARDLSALPIDLQPGDMLLVDEAGMATTADLAALTEIAEESGAIVRLVGDPYQLDSVERGGMFSTIVKHDNSVELDQVMRVGNDTAQAEAGLAIRHGDVTGLDLYAERGWIHDGPRTAMVADAVNDYLADVAAGRSALLIATLREDVNEANTMIQNAMIEQGEVDVSGRSIQLGTGHSLHKGDVILARANKWFGQQRLINGTRLTVEGIKRNGTVIARDEERGRVYALPKSYVSQHIQLGYAATVHRAQGTTVDVTRAVVSSSTDRRGLYVALTRGRRQNHVYVSQDTGIDLDAEDGHWHMSGEDTPATGREILERIVSRDTGQRSATEVREELIRASRSPKRARELFGVAADVLTANWRTNVLEPDVRRWLDKLPVEQTESLDEENAVERIATAAVALSQHGIDYRELMPRAVEKLFAVRDAGAVIAHRLYEHMPSDRAALRELPPVHEGTDHELHAWAAGVRETLAPGGRVLKPLSDPLPERGTVEGRDFTDVDLRGVDLSRLTFKHCTFNGAAFDQATLDDVYFGSCEMRGATFTGATFSGGSNLLAQVVFNDSDLRRADFTDVSAKRSVFTSCDMRETELSGAEFDSTHFTGVDFYGCDLSDLRMTTDVTLDYCALDKNAPEELRDRNHYADPNGAYDDQQADTLADVWGAQEESTDTDGPVL